MVTVHFLLAAGVGLGVWTCARALAPRPQPIPEVLAALDRPGRPLTAAAEPARPAVVDRAGGLARQLLDRAGLASAGHAAAMELIERTPERHALEKVTAALVGLLTPVVLALVLGIAGIHVPPVLPILGSFTAAAGGFLLPDLTLRDQATARRRAFRHALSAYLDLVNILLAGGAGIETALYAAADAGDGWAFERLRYALHRARRIGQSPWDSLADLGSSLDVRELSELAASVSLAGSHGARIRASLAAKADALRGHQVAETEAAAESATERMTIPLAVLLFGFLVLIAYPAIQQVTTATTGA